jgi:dihydropteroate synthase
MPRRRFEWKLRTRSLTLGDRTLIMGVLNITPDSFSDGGQYDDPDRAYARALQMEDEGADIIDIGAESTRPGSERVPEGEELRRLIPVLKRLRGALHVPISVDTYKAAVALKALEYDAEIINDPSGLTFDTDLAKAVANANAGLIINHMRGTPQTWAKLPPMKDVMGTIGRELDAAINRARRAGVELERIIIDPGIGFGKRREQNAEILARLGGLNALNRPILVGPSRKHFLAQPEQELTEFATAAAAAAAVLNGAHIARVHDVKAIAAAVQITDSIIAAQPEPAAEREAPRKRPPAMREIDREKAEAPKPVRPRVQPKRAEPEPERRTAPSEERRPRGPFGPRPDRGGRREEREERPRGPFGPRQGRGDREQREDRPRGPFGPRQGRGDREQREDRPRGPFGPRQGRGDREQQEERPRGPFGPRQGRGDREHQEERPRGPFGPRPGRGDREQREERPRGPFRGGPPRKGPGGGGFKKGPGGGFKKGPGGGFKKGPGGGFKGGPKRGGSGPPRRGR